MRRGLTWLLVAPLVLLGSQAAHTVVYWLAAPGQADREQLLAETGHDYLHAAPAAIALCFALIVLALGGRLLEAYREERPGRGLSLTPFAVLPLVVFVLQEHLERLVEDTGFPSLALEPIFLIGLALQLPFALLAYVVARALLGAADRLARMLDGRLTPPLAPPRLRLVPAAADLPRLSPHATSRTERGPPQSRR